MLVDDESVIGTRRIIGEGVALIERQDRARPNNEPVHCYC
jgi:hypothetical protein